jgi:hypothetical protein
VVLTKNYFILRSRSVSVKTSRLMQFIVYSSLSTILACGLVKGEQGEPGAAGPAGTAGIDGKDGSDGQKGADGSSGRNGLPGSSGKNGAPGGKGDPGNIEYLVEETATCKARDDYKYGWYELKLEIYWLSTGEQYLYARSDLHEGKDLTPDSAIAFAKEVQTANYRFWEEDSQWLWKNVRSNNQGSLLCE